MRAPWCKAILASTLLLSWPGTLHAGKYAGAFLEIGVGAKALAMGGAYTAVASDGSAFYWNPAGLAILTRPEVNVMYATHFGTLIDPLASYNQAGIALPLKGREATVAVNYIRLSVDDIPLYPELEGASLGQRLRDPRLRPTGQPLGYFNDREEAFYFSFAKMNRFNLDLGWQYLTMPIEIPLGVNFKMIRQRLGPSSASGLGIDVGGMLRFNLGEFFDNEGLGDFSFGFNLQDLAQTRLSWNTRHQDSIERNLKWGLAYRHPFAAGGSAVLVSMEHDSRYQGSNHVGAEYAWSAAGRLVGLRAGFDDGRFTAGAGVGFWKVTLHYAFVGYELGNVHRLSGSFRF